MEKSSFNKFNSIVDNTWVRCIYCTYTFCTLDDSCVPIRWYPRCFPHIGHLVNLGSISSSEIVLNIWPHALMYVMSLIASPLSGQWPKRAMRLVNILHLSTMYLGEMSLNSVRNSFSVSRRNALNRCTSTRTSWSIKKYARKLRRRLRSAGCTPSYDDWRLYSDGDGSRARRLLHDRPSSLSDICRKNKIHNHLSYNYFKIKLVMIRF